MGCLQRVKTGEAVARSHRRRWRAAARGAVPVDRTEGRRPGLLDLTDRRVVLLRRRWGGQRGRSGTGGEQLLGSELPAAAESGENPAQAKVEVGVGGRSAAPGARAKLLQGWPGLWHGGAASPRRRRGGAEAGERLGFGAAAAMEVRCRGCGCRLKKKGARDLGVRDGQGNHGEDHGRDSGGR